DDVPADRIGLADHLAAADAASREEDAEREGMVVAPRVRFASRAILAERRAAELRSPDDERLVEEAALLEIANERRDRLVRHARVELELAVEVRVLIPGCVIDVDEAHAALD